MPTSKAIIPKEYPQKLSQLNELGDVPLESGMDIRNGLMALGLAKLMLYAENAPADLSDGRSPKEWRREI